MQKQLEIVKNELDVGLSTKKRREKRGERCYELLRQQRNDLWISRCICCSTSKEVKIGKGGKVPQKLMLFHRQVAKWWQSLYSNKPDKRTAKLIIQEISNIYS